jgi:phospholipid N-methyltransferase
MDSSIYTRPKKPRYIEVKQRGRTAPKVKAVDLPVITAIHGSSECHITPQRVAEQMAEYLSPEAHKQIFEPHGGNGSLVNALIEHGALHSDIVINERNYDLFNILKKRFSGINDITNNCIFDLAQENDKKYTYIIMNPPYKKIKNHFMTALSFLANDGVLVALVPSNFEHPEAEDLDFFNNDLFTTTKITTKIIIVDRR